jgi:hypothetical protein
MRMRLERAPMKPSTFAAAGAYFAATFGLGFVLGTLRVLVLVPRLGELVAVMLELPLMLTASWFICRRVVRHHAVAPDAAPRLAMGAAAFALLMVAEFALAVSAFGRSPGAFRAGLVTPAGAIGLAGQALFGLWPWWQGRQARLASTRR